MEYGTIEIRREGAVVVLEMIREEKLNPLDLQAGDEILDALKNLEREEGMRCLIITGRGRAFSAGGDVKGMEDSLQAGKPGEYMDDLTRSLYAIGLRLREYPVPVIAAVNGLAVGAGMNLALCCDIIVASRQAAFSQSFCRLALIPGFGGTYLLSRQLPWQKAAEIAFLGEALDAEEMRSMGFVRCVAEADRLMSEAMRLAETLAAGPTLAYARTKKLFLEAQGSSFQDHLPRERELQVRSAETEDYAAGVHGLVSKKKPLFSGK